MFLKTGALIVLTFAGILPAQSPTGFYCPDTGAANTITCATYVALTALSPGMSFDVLLKNSVTGAATLVVDGLSGVPVTYNGTNAMVGGIMFAGNTYRLTFEGTEAVLQGSVSGCNTGCATGTITQQSVTLTIPNAQVLTLHSVGFVLLPAAGAGTFLEFVSMAIENVFLTATYTGGGSLTVNYGFGGSAATSTINSGFLVGPVVNQFATLTPFNPSLNFAASAVLNKPLVLQITAGGADPAGGSGSVIVHLTYRVHTGFL